jgi:Sec-independent protein translocase protein TatA
MLIKIVVLFLILMVVLAIFGRLRLPGIRRKRG